MQAVVRLGRGLVTVIALAALAGVLFFSLADPGSLLFSVPSVLVASSYTAVGLQTGAFFFLEIAVSALWAVSMDLGGRKYSGTVSGLMNTGFGVAGIVSPVVFGVMVDRTGSWVGPYMVGAVLLAVGIVTIMLTDARKSGDDSVSPGKCALVRTHAAAELGHHQRPLG